MSDAVAGVVVAVATYRRPRLLGELLASIADIVPVPGLRVVVVDNDPSGSAAEVVRSSPLPVTYIVEEQPGIAAARNRALDALDDADRAVVFVDDDERVHASWLSNMMRGWENAGAAVITGPVISVFAPSAPRWIVDGGFIQRTRHRTGTELHTAATNNTLLALDHWRRAGRPRFDDAFSESGGSDTEFFGRLFRGGASIVWIDDAVVEENVPESRTTFRWIWQRAVRGGSVQARIALRQKSRGALSARTAIALPLRAAGLAVGLLRHRRLRATDLVPFAWQCGIASALTGVVTREYRRN